MPDTEANRIAQVYQQYLAQDLERSRWSDANAGNEAIQRERDAAVKRMLAEAGFMPLTACRILEVGCGWGKVLAELVRWGALPRNVLGIDLIPEAIEFARRQHPDIQFEVANGEEIPFEATSFDLVVFYTVFSSILDDRVALQVAAEARRVLRPGGAIVWYDFRLNNPRNRHVRGVPRAVIRHLFPGLEARLHRVTVVPPLARRLGQYTSRLYPVLATLPFLLTHYAGLLIKPRSEHANRARTCPAETSGPAKIGVDE
jgi:ubiquinone/menaquinone biosynthesis C-methylase UbiE